MLTQLDEDKPFITETDILEWAINYSLFETTNNKTHLIAYDGQKLTPIEIKYSVHKKEFLAIKSAICIWNYYINNLKMTVVLIDYESLKYLKRTKNFSKLLAK